MALSARTIMITGASRGLGLEFVKQLVKQKIAPEVLIATCRNPASASDLQAIAKSNPSVKIVKLDVENDEDIDSAFQETKSAVGDFGLNLLINNAGINDKADGGNLPKATRERMQRHFNVNVSAPIMLTQKFLPLLEQAASQDKGKPLSCSRAGIVMISSVMGSQGVTYKTGAGISYHYKCSKTAATMAALLMSRELKDSGIAVFALHPGWVQTDMGGMNADLNVEQSISSCLKVIADVGEDGVGKLWSYTGEILPY